MGLKVNRLVISAIFATFFLTFLSTTALASIYLNVSATPIVQPGISINVTGSVVNTTTSDTISGINVSATTTSAGNWNVTPSSGYFSFIVPAPSVPGPYNLSITTNSSSLINKVISFTVVNETGSTSSITYNGKFPPFSAGTTFTINVTLKNNSTLLSGVIPNVSVYPANGPKTSWTIVNNSNATDSNGLAQFNITVPSGATAGDYAIVVDNGALFSAFQVGSGYVMAVQTLTTQSEVSSFFPQSSTVSILAKLRDSSGTPVTGATVSAVITFPNGTTLSSPVILSANSASSGYYNNTFTDTSASGAYKIKVTATISGTNVTGSGIFNTQVFTASLQPQKSFFFEWGGQGSFKPSSTFALDIVPTNLADGSTITNATCPGSSYSLVDLTYANGTSVLNTFFANSSLTNYSFIPSNSPSGSVCAIQFGNATVNSNISIADVYNAKVNVTVGNEWHTVNGFFSIQNYFLKVVPVLSLGGEDNFIQVVSPGSTITLALKVANVTSGAGLAPTSITNQIVTSILPLEFSSGTNETTTITQTSTAGSGTATDPTISMVLPSNIQGPLLIKAQATVAGQTITGNAFVIANYLTGGISTQSVRGGDLGPGGDMGGAPSGGAGMLCAGTKQFNGMVQDAATGTAAQGATVVGILQAREAETGKDVSSFLSIAAATASDSSGQLSANITFTPGSYSFTGDYFMVLNATYKNVSAGVPGFFQCKNLNTGFPQISTAGTTSNMGFFVSPTAGLNMTLSSVTNMTGSLINASSTVGIRQIFNFNPGSGSMKILTNNTPVFATFANNSGTMGANIVFYPQNFSVNGVALTQWPNGFFDVRPTIIASITGTSGTVSDTTHGGFQVVAFNAFPETFGFGSASVGSVQSTIIDIQANGTWNRTGGWNSTIYIGSIGGSDIVNNNTFVNVTIGRPWEGEMTTITSVNATLISDGWNSASDSNNFTIQGGPFERWNITYTIPTTVSKGFAMVTITVNGTTNAGTSFNKVDIPLALSVAKYNVIIPSQEGVGDSGSGSGFDGYGIAFDPTTPNPNKVNQTAFGSWNPTYLTSTFNINSASGVVCVKNNFNSTRYGNGPSTTIQNFNGSTKLLVLDNATAGVYDTVVLNITNPTAQGTIVVLNALHRNATFPDGTGGLYLWQIDNCGYFTVVNTTKASITSGGSFVQSYGGSHQKNVNFNIPYVVALGGATNPTFQSGNSVGIKGIGQQNPGKNGGFGFAGKLAAGTDYTTGGSVVTDANGVAFITVNVTTTGQFMAFWNVTVSGDTDAADFSSATFFDARAFNAYTNTINSTAIYRVVMYNNATAGGSFTGSPAAYNGSVNTADGTLFVEYNNATNQNFAMSFNAPTNPGSSTTTINQTLSMGGSSYNVAWITPNVTSAADSTNNRTILIFKNSNFQSGVISVTSATQNVTISVCGQGFSGQPPAIVTNMTVNNVTVQDWAHGASTKLLTMYELMNNTNVTGTGVLAGPDGCALLNIGPGQLGSWPAASGFAPPVFANAYVTNNADSQQIYVANIFRTG